MKHTAKFLRDARIKAGLSQQDVGDALGYGSGHQPISNYERGTCSPPLAQLANLIKVLKIDADKLIEVYMRDKREHLQKVMRVR